MVQVDDSPEMWASEAVAVEKLAVAFAEQLSLIVPADRFNIYVHILFAHFPMMIAANGNLVKFACQGMCDL